MKGRRVGVLPRLHRQDTRYLQEAANRNGLRLSSCHSAFESCRITKASRLDVQNKILILHMLVDQAPSKLDEFRIMVGGQGRGARQVHGWRRSTPAYFRTIASSSTGSYLPGMGPQHLHTVAGFDISDLFALDHDSARAVLDEYGPARQVKSHNPATRIRWPEARPGVNCIRLHMGEIMTSCGVRHSR